MNYRYTFDELSNSELFVDAVYEASPVYKNTKGEPFHMIFPKCGNLGGFRKVNRQGSNKLAYVVLYTSMQELEWPDYLDEETGIFRYYGDNRQPGNDIHDTKARGNLLLKEVFSLLSSVEGRKDIPPFFIFKKDGTGRNIKFLGLAAPGNPSISPDKDLVSFWRTLNENRFQNYEAYFTILDTKDKPISRKWLNSLIYDYENNLQYAPEAWNNFVNYGRNGIKALKAPKIISIPSKLDQLQSDEEGRNCLEIIRNYYADNQYSFEVCAVDIMCKLDSNFVDFSLTRPWRDGGRDAIGYYSIKPGGKANYPLKIDCALEAKCYSKDNSVGVREMSRLISRIRYRQFGALITTSYVHSQAYKEVVEDQHPILIVTASDIASVLRKNSITTANINDWLHELKDQRFEKDSIQ